MKSTDDLRREYVEALRSHLSSPSEASLARAYAVGREVAGGGSAVHLAALHCDAMAGVLAEARSVPDAVAQARVAQGFLLEALAPLEMIVRGYQDANRSLRALNAHLEEAKQKADGANRELEAFSYSVAHDLRAPLRSIRGFAGALAEDHGVGLGAEANDALVRIRGASDRMERLIDDLLRLSGIARAELQRVPVDLARLAREIVARLHAAQPDRRVAFACPATQAVIGDPRLLELALENLLGNAWKFTARRPLARIELGFVDRQGGRAHFVRDDGAGFDAASARNLFAPFQRFHSATEFEGTGIGLAIVQRVIRRHGGRVSVESAVGQGATFWFTVPEKEDEEE